MAGLEVAAWPILYPWSRYGDTDVRARLSAGGSGSGNQHYSGKQSYVRKLLSRCRAYDQEPSLAFYLHDVFVARSFLCKLTVAEHRKSRYHPRYHIRLDDLIGVLLATRAGLYGGSGQADGLSMQNVCEGRRDMELSVWQYLCACEGGH